MVTLIVPPSVVANPGFAVHVRSVRVPFLVTEVAGCLDGMRGRSDGCRTVRGRGLMHSTARGMGPSATAVLLGKHWDGKNERSRQK
jgi:hypothetical protein